MRKLLAVLTLCTLSIAPIVTSAGTSPAKPNGSIADGSGVIPLGHSVTFVADGSGVIPLHS